MDRPNNRKPHSQLHSSRTSGARERRDIDRKVFKRSDHPRGSEFAGRRSRHLAPDEKGDHMEVEMKIRGLMMDPVSNMPIVVLKDTNGNAILPIWVGIYEANAIALEIEKVAPPRHARSHQDAAAWPRHGHPQSGGERAQGRYVLRRDLAG